MDKQLTVKFSGGREGMWSIGRERCCWSHWEEQPC